MTGVCKKILLSCILAVAVLVCPVGNNALHAQNISVSTNAVEWANLGTMNVELGYAFSQHFSGHVGIRINPWSFGVNDPDDRYEDITDMTKKRFQNQQETVSLSVRWWPWHIFSGWWVRGVAQYSHYDRGGIFRKQRYVGDAFGAGIGVGYTVMLSENWNLDFGVSGWAGSTNEAVHESLVNVSHVEPERRFFILPDEVNICIVYVF